MEIIAFIIILLGVVYVAWYSLINTKDILNPVFIVGLIYIVLYLGKYIFIVANESLVFSYNYREPFSESALYSALLYSFFSYFLFSLGFFSLKSRLNRIELRGSGFSSWVLFLGFGFSLLSFYIIYADYNLDQIFILMGNRFDLFMGRGYLMVPLMAYKVALFLYISASDKKFSAFKIIILWFPAILFDIFSGSRGRLIFENIIPFIYLLSYKKYFNISVSKFLLGSVLLFLLAISSRAFLRDSGYEFNKHLSSVEVVVEELRNVGTRFYEGPEAPYIDGLIFLMDSHRNYLLGETLLSIFTYPFPSALFPDKLRGASSVLTEFYFPYYFYPSKIEIAFPLMSEFYVNFGLIGVLLFIPLGMLSGYLYRSIFNQGGVVSVILIFVSIRLVLLFRNDLLNNFISFISFISVVFVFIIVSKFKIQVR